MKAFPNPNNTSHHGMDLRDYFAAKAMQGILSDPDLAINNEKIAEWAYTLAEAMMKERKK